MKEVTKSRLHTIVITSALLLLATLVNVLYTSDLLPDSPMMTVVMLVSTSIYMFGGCALQTFRHNTIAMVIGIIVFFILCTCLFYSNSALDFVIFFDCMGLVIYKSIKVCECLEDCKGPFRKTK